MGDDSDDGDVMAGLFDDGVCEYAQVPLSEAELAAQAWADKVRTKTEGAEDAEHEQYIRNALTPNGLWKALINLQKRLGNHNVTRERAESFIHAMLGALELNPRSPTDFQRAWFGQTMLDDIVTITSRLGKAEVVQIPGPPLIGGSSHMRGEKLFEGITFKEWNWHNDDESFTF
jgi:hypothetical protein